MKIRELAEREKIPRKLLEQILLSMKAADLIASHRGRDGGYETLKPAAQISFGQPLRAIDGPIAPLPCLSRTAYRPLPGLRQRRPASCAAASPRPTLEKTTPGDVMLPPDVAGTGPAADADTLVSNPL